MGQQKARRRLASPGKESSRKRSMRCRQASSVAGGSQARALGTAPGLEVGGDGSHAVGSFMIRCILRNLAVALTLVSATAFGANGTDEAVLAAFDAYRAGDPIKLAKHAKKLEGHLLTPWL